MDITASVAACLSLESHRFSQSAHVAKFDPTQPRKPKGDPEGGQWTDGDGASLRDIAECVSKPFGADADKCIPDSDDERTALLIRIMRARDKLLEGVHGDKHWRLVDAGIDRLARTINGAENQEAVMDAWIDLGAPDVYDLSHVADQRYAGAVLDKIVDKLPSSYDGALQLYSKDYDVFEEQFIGSWTLMGGGPAQLRAHAALALVGVNKEKGLWDMASKFSEAPNLYKNIIQSPSLNLQANLLKLYAKTQSYYAEKYPGKDLSSVMLTVGRGIKTPVANYAPAGMESWSLDKSTPKKFAGKEGTVLLATVPVSAVVVSWESAKGVWPSEDMLRGKKEVVIFGGGIQSLVKG